MVPDMTPNEIITAFESPVYQQQEPLLVDRTHCNSDHAAKIPLLAIEHLLDRLGKNSDPLACTRNGPFRQPFRALQPGPEIRPPRVPFDKENCPS